MSSSVLLDPVALALPLDRPTAEAAKRQMARFIFDCVAPSEPFCVADAERTAEDVVEHGLPWGVVTGSRYKVDGQIAYLRDRVPMGRVLDHPTAEAVRRQMARFIFDRIGDPDMDFSDVERSAAGVVDGGLPWSVVTDAHRDIDVLKQVGLLKSE